MSTTREGKLGGRPVELRQVGFGVGWQSQAVLKETGDSFVAGLVILAASAHWADTGEKVFADYRAVMDWPMVDSADIFKLATEAGMLNAPRTEPQANGQDGPSLLSPSASSLTA
jgi:hypothetical protein